MSLLSPQLVAFLAITQYKTVHAAADALYITQTAVTQRIHVLEKNLKTTLFIRTRKGMILTSEGESLLHYCQAAQNLEGTTLAKIKNTAIETSIQITISGPSSIMQSRIIPQCILLIKKFPQLLFNFDISDVEERHKSLHRGLCDFAILQPENIAKGMDYKMLHAEKYVLVAAYPWKNRSLKSILSEEKIIDYNPQDPMTLNYLKYFNLYQYAQHERHFASRTESIMFMISEELGYSVLTTEFAQPYIKSKKLVVLNQNKTYENQLALAWFNRPEPPKYFSALINNTS